MKPKFVIILFFLSLIGHSQQYQAMTCDQALVYIQNYGNSVVNSYNQSATWIQYNVHPYYQQAQYNQLNQWYSQQAMWVNQTHQSIYSACFNSQIHVGNSGRISNDFEQQIAMEQNRLKKNNNDGKRVRLRIPETAAGWRSGN